MYRAANFAESTKRAYKTHRKMYYEFCSNVGVQPVPASTNTIVQYAAFLARRLKPASVRQYLNIIRVLHLECNLPNPLHDNWFLKSTLTGMERLLGTPERRRTPVHPLLLLEINGFLDFTKIFDIMFWAACLVMFFGLLRKSNLFPNSTSQYNGNHQFIRSDFSLSQDGSIYAIVKHTKTNQFQKRSFELKFLPCEHILSPVKAITNAFDKVRLPKEAPAFVSSAAGTPMTGSEFNSRFKELVSRSGFDATTYSSHSFRRGGASWALQCGVPGEVVQLLGDWKSDCYKKYLDSLPQQVHDRYRKLVIESLP